jgi:ADP-ribosylglycohydrolase
MFPDGLVDFWTVDLPERPRAGRADALSGEPPVVPTAATPGRAALEYAAMVATARSLARRGARLDPADLMDALVDCRRGVGTQVQGPGAAFSGAAAADAAAARRDAAEGGADDHLLLLRSAPPARRASSPYTDLATEALATAAAAAFVSGRAARPDDPAALAALAEAAMARGVARTAPTASVRPQRREFGAHDFGLTAAGVAAPLGLAYQYAPPSLLASAVDAAVAATHPDPQGRDGAAVVAAAVAWLARRGQREDGWRRRRRWQRRRAAPGGGADEEEDADAADGDQADASAGPHELAAHLLSIAPALRLGQEAREVLAMVAGALGVDLREHEEAAAAAAADPGLAPRHPLGRGGKPLAGVVPPALDCSPGRWRVFWLSPEWAELSAAAARVAGGPFATSGVRLAGLAVLLVGAAGFGSNDEAAAQWQRQRRLREEEGGQQPAGAAARHHHHRGGNPAAQAVSLAATMGGACAAQASVVGAMVGALHGAAWVPRRWWRRLEDLSPSDAARAREAWDGVGRGAAAALGAALGGAAVEAAVAEGWVDDEGGEGGGEGGGRGEEEGERRRGAA